MRLILVALATTALIGTAVAQPAPQHSPTLPAHSVLTPHAPLVIQPQAAPTMTAPSATSVGCPGTNDAPGHTGATSSFANAGGHPGAIGGGVDGKSGGDEPPKDDGPHENPHGENPHGMQAMTDGSHGAGPVLPGGRPGTFADAPRGNGENPSPPPHGQNSVSPDAPQGQNVGGARLATTGIHLPGGGTVNPQADAVGGGGAQNPIGGQRGPGQQIHCQTHAMDGGGGIVPPH